MKGEGEGEGEGWCSRVGSKDEGDLQASGYRLGLERSRVERLGEVEHGRLARLVGLRVSGLRLGLRFRFKLGLRLGVRVKGLMSSCSPVRVKVRVGVRVGVRVKVRVRVSLSSS